MWSDFKHMCACTHVHWFTYVLNLVNKTATLLHHIWTNTCFLVVNIFNFSWKYFEGKIYTNGYWFVKFMKIFRLEKIRYVVTMVLTINGYVYNRCLYVNSYSCKSWELLCAWISDGSNRPFAQCYTNGHVLEVEQAPFVPAIAKYYWMAILSIENDLSQKLDLDAVAFVASSN